MKTLLFTLLLTVASVPMVCAEEAGPKPEPAPVEEKAKPSPEVIYRKNEKYKFSGLRLKGQLKKPDLSYIYKRAGLKSEKIVDIPENFNDEILKGAEQF